MVFSSVIFIFYFLPITLLLYYFVPAKAKNIVLLLLSLVFYAWGEPKVVFLMLALIGLDYGLGLAFESFACRKLLLILGIILNIGFLFFYKYLNFSIDIFNDLLSFAHIHRKYPHWNIVLPIGLSFYTFQGLSYVIDVYRGTVKAQKSPIKLALYIAMFPQLIAGPIVRYTEIEKYLDKKNLSLENTAEGASRFIYGLGKKVMIADVLAKTVDEIFTTGVTQLTTPVAWIGAVLYMLQIYYDFSGYSDMAIGLGRMLGFRFSENFNYPYTSKTISEFWRRWHISLGSWFRDYLYIPLGGSRTGNVYFNLAVVFVVTGLWHGAEWNYVLWGLWHGAFVLFERKLKKTLNCQSNLGMEFLGRVYTGIVVLLGWVLFRSVSIPYAKNYIRLMFGYQFQDDFLLYNIWHYIDAQVIATAVVGVLLATGVTRRINSSMSRNNTLALAFKYLGALFVLFFSLSMVINGNYSPFIYFRF